VQGAAVCAAPVSTGGIPCHSATVQCGGVGTATTVVGRVASQSAVVEGAVVGAAPKGVSRVSDQNAIVECAAVCAAAACGFVATKHAVGDNRMVGFCPDAATVAEERPRPR